MNNKTYYVYILASKDLITEIEIEDLRIKRKKTVFRLDSRIRGNDKNTLFIK